MLNHWRTATSRGLSSCSRANITSIQPPHWNRFGTRTNLAIPLTPSAWNERTHTTRLQSPWQRRSLASFSALKRGRGRKRRAKQQPGRSAKLDPVAVPNTSLSSPPPLSPLHVHRNTDTTRTSLDQWGAVDANVGRAWSSVCGKVPKDYDVKYYWITTERSIWNFNKTEFNLINALLGEMPSLTLSTEHVYSHKIDFPPSVAIVGSGPFAERMAQLSLLRGMNVCYFDPFDPAGVGCVVDNMKLSLLAAKERAVNIQGLKDRSINKASKDLSKLLERFYPCDSYHHVTRTCRRLNRDESAQNSREKHSQRLVVMSCVPEHAVKEVFYGDPTMCSEDSIRIHADQKLRKYSLKHIKMSLDKLYGKREPDIYGDSLLWCASEQQPSSKRTATNQPTTSPLIIDFSYVRGMDAYYLEYKAEEMEVSLVGARPRGYNWRPSTFFQPLWDPHPREMARGLQAVADQMLDNYYRMVAGHSWARGKDATVDPGLSYLVGGYQGAISQAIPYLVFLGGRRGVWCGRLPHFGGWLPRAGRYFSWGWGAVSLLLVYVFAPKLYIMMRLFFEEGGRVRASGGKWDVENDARWCKAVVEEDAWNPLLDLYFSLSLSDEEFCGQVWRPFQASDPHPRCVSIHSQQKK